MDHSIELYDAISDMIDCEMGTGLEDTELTALTPADLDVITDNPIGIIDSQTPPNSVGETYGLDTELGISESGISWYQTNQPLYTVNNSDFEQTGGGLMVNPQTGIPISVNQQQSVLSDSLCPTPPSTQSSSTVYMSTPPPDGGITISSAVSNSANPANVHLSNVSNVHRISVSNQQRSKVNSVQRKPGKELTLIDPQERKFPKPTYSYSCLIAMSLKNSRSGCLPVSEIYDFMTEHFPYFKTAPNGWKNSVRHNLSLNKCFEKIVKPDTGTQRKGCLWAMNPAKVTKMDEEIQKWKRKDPDAIRQSMAKPEVLESLERGELKPPSPTEEEVTADSTTEGGHSPDTNPGNGGGVEYSNRSDVSPLPDLGNQQCFWEEFNHPQQIQVNQAIAIKSEVMPSSTTSHQLEQMLNHPSNISSSSSPHHSLVSSSTSDIQGNFSYTNLQSMSTTSSVNIDSSSNNNNGSSHQVIIKQEADTWSSQDSSAIQLSSSTDVNKCESSNNTNPTKSAAIVDSQKQGLFHQTSSTPRNISAYT